MKPLVILESPFGGLTPSNIDFNVKYARRCLRNSIDRGEAPIASHLLYPQVLDEDVAEDRNLGIDCGLAWLRHANLHIFYTDLGWSPGMLRALQYDWEQAYIGIDLYFRSLDSKPIPPSRGQCDFIDDDGYRDLCNFAPQE